jgi:hypothetical protein
MDHTTADAGEIAKKVKALPPVAKRNMIADLYAALARSVIPVGEERIQWMTNFIQNTMSDNEINKEWEFIQKGNVHKLVNMFQQLKQPGMEEMHAEKLEDLAQLAEQVGEGILRTKEAGGEIDPQTYDAVEKIVMDFADEFIAEMRGDKTPKLADKKTKLLNSYPTVAKVLEMCP